MYAKQHMNCYKKKRLLVSQQSTLLDFQYSLTFAT